MIICGGVGKLVEYKESRTTEQSDGTGSLCLISCGIEETWDGPRLGSILIERWEARLPYLGFSKAAVKRENYSVCVLAAACIPIETSEKHVRWDKELSDLTFARQESKGYRC